MNGHRQSMEREKLFSLPKPETTILALLLTIQGCRSANHAPSKADKNKTAHTPPRGQLANTETLELKILEIRSKGRKQTEMRFFRGESLDCILQVSGFSAPRQKLHLLSTLTLKQPGRGLLWKEGPKTLVNQPIPKGRSTRRVRLKLGLRLSTAEPSGKHLLLLRIDEPETHRYGTAALEFSVVGRRLRRFSKLTIAGLQPPDTLDLRPGGQVHLPLWVGGFHGVRMPNGRHRLVLAGTVSWHPPSETGRPQNSPQTTSPLSNPQTFRIAFDDLRFVPAQVPLWLPVNVPTRLGRYDLTITVREDNTPARDRPTARAANASTKQPSSIRRTIHGLVVQPAGLGLYDMRVLGPGDSPIRSFHRGQTMKISFEVWSPTSKNLVGDIAVQGPQGGLYLIRKQAFTIRPDKQPSHSKMDALSRRILVPIELPRYCPAGKYRLLVRLRDANGKETATRQLSFTVEGRALPPLPSLRITDWSLGQGPTLLPRLSQGQELPIQVVVGGMHLETKPPSHYRMDLVLNLILRNSDGKLLTKEPEAAHLSRTFTFAPRRVPLEATWRVPDGVSGVLLLQVEVEDLLTHKVSLSQRKILVLPK